MLGIPIGVYLLAYTDAGILKIVLGTFLLAYGTYALLSPRLHTVSFGGRGADAAVGFIGGVLGGIGGYSGVLPTIWTQLRGWPKEVARGVYQPYIIVVQMHHARRYRLGDARPHRPGAARLGAAAAPARHLDRLAALRPAR